MYGDHHVASLAAHQLAQISLTVCSKTAWRSTLLRRYSAPAVIEQLATPPRRIK